MVIFGFLKPKYIFAKSQNRRGMWNFFGVTAFKSRTSTSPKLTGVAWTLHQDFIVPGNGFSTSLSCRTSGGPYFVRPSLSFFYPHFFARAKQKSQTASPPAIVIVRRHDTRGDMFS